jgi:hypothetical protein
VSWSAAPGDQDAAPAGGAEWDDEEKQ